MKLVLRILISCDTKAEKQFFRPQFDIPLLDLNNWMAAVLVWSSCVRLSHSLIGRG